VVVRPPVPGLLVLGVGIGGVGGLGLLGGAFLLLVNALVSDGSYNDGNEGKFYGSVLAVMGGGALLIGGGILLGKEYGNAKVSQVVEPGQQGAQASCSWMPSWTQAPLEGRTGSLSSTIPIVGGRF
jgi:hypothetical protein